MEIDSFEQHISKTEKVLSISDYLKVLNVGLKNYKAKIIGEVSDISFGPTGHVYFKLKDKKDESTIKCIIWKNKYELYGVKLKEGVEIISFGCPSMHPKYGFSFIADTIEYVGEGILKAEYDKLKKQLIQEGIFAEEKKRAIPEYAENIGVITSKSGAVIHDFTTNLGKHGFRIKLIDSRVEGQDAVEDLLFSINLFKKQNIDVLIIMRGGGSLESLLAFNNGKIVREVSGFPVPVIAAIGHEKNVPLMSMAADAMVSTPTAAANFLNKPWEQAQSKIEKYERDIVDLYGHHLSELGKALDGFYYKLKEGFDLILGGYKEFENKLKGFLSVINNQLILKKNNIIDDSKSISRYFVSNLQNIKEAILNMENIVRSNNPERQLKLGYSIARHKGSLIKSVKDVKIESDIDIRVFDGIIKSKVKDINNK